MLNLRAVGGQLLRNRWWLVLSMLFFAGAGAALAFSMNPVYRSSAVLIAAASDGGGLAGTLNSALGSLGGIAALAGVSVGGSNTQTEEAKAVLSSRQFTESFIEDLHLMPVLFASRWDASSGKWRVGVNQQPTPAKAFRYFDERVRTVAQDRRSGLITIQIDWRDRVAAADWANELVRRLNLEMRRRAIAKADASLVYLRSEVAKTDSLDTREAINRLIEAQIKQRMLANVSEDYVFRIVDRAMAPDADDPVRPNKILMILAGLLGGFLIGAVMVLMLAQRQQPGPESHNNGS